MLTSTPSRLSFRRRKSPRPERRQDKSGRDSGNAYIASWTGSNYEQIVPPVRRRL